MRSSRWVVTAGVAASVLLAACGSSGQSSSQSSSTAKAQIVWAWLLHDDGEVAANRWVLPGVGGS